MPHESKTMQKSSFNSHVYWDTLKMVHADVTVQFLSERSVTFDHNLIYETYSFRLFFFITFAF